MKPIIVVTRTRPDADVLAEKLASLGYEPLIEPMLSVRPTHAPSPHDPVCTEGLVVTSAQALRHMNSGVVRAMLRGKPVYAVGAKTAALARKLGWPVVHDGGGDVRALGSFLRSRPEITPSTRLLHICGRDTAHDTRDLLAQAPGKIWTWVVYEAECSRVFSPAMDDALRTGRVRGVMLHSPRAGIAFAQNVQAYEQRGENPGVWKGIISLCLSGAVLESVASASTGGAYAANTPDEDAMLALLKAHIPTDQAH